VIFVHGCFWHCHERKDSGTPKPNTGFWATKLADNARSDTKNQSLLKERGECAIDLGM